MSLTGWIIFFLIIQVIHFLGTWKLYQKAGRKAWEALVPIYNGIILMKIINRPSWYVLLLFIPVVNLLMFPVVWVETIRSFGKNKALDTWLVLLTFGLYIYYLNYFKISELTHIPDRDLKPKNVVADFVSSTVFAVIVATVIHTYAIQPFVIPTGSLEKTLLVGDFLLVSKVHYGARTPMTAVALPMVHDTLPLVPTSYEGLPSYINRFPSYLKCPQIPYFRFPAFTDVKKNDIVVFNWPVDTIRYFGDKTAKDVRKPLDKKSNYVKRCVGEPGDSLVGINGELFINGKQLEFTVRDKPQYITTITAKENLTQELLDKYQVAPTGFSYKVQAKIWEDPAVKQYFANPNNGVYLSEQNRDSLYVYAFGSVTNQEVMQRLGIEMNTKQISVLATIQQAEALKNDQEIEKVERVSLPPDQSIFPHTKQWSVDNFGPIYIPKAGATVELNKETLPFYKGIIRDYEHNDLKVIGDEILINNVPSTSYTFKQDYYWMMGDNRHNSEDSRMWGYVPADHIVGKPIFIWMSYDSVEGKIRWDRVFTTVSGDGEPVSYFRWFLMALGIYFVADYFIKRKKKKNSKQI